MKRNTLFFLAALIVVYLSGSVTSSGQSLSFSPVVQAAQGRLEQAGYYSGPLTGTLDLATAAAVARFQTRNDLLATGAIDEPTAEALGIQLSMPDMGPALP